MKNKLFTFVIILAVIGGFAWSFLTGIDHIEDTNGPDNYKLQQITDPDIIEMEMGSTGGPTIRRNVLLGDAVGFSAEKFTGVYEILYDNYILPSDFVIDLVSYEITGGNFQMVVVHEDEIVATLEPGTFVTYRLDNVTGNVSLRIVGESAAFSFVMTESDYADHSHVD